MRWENGEFVEHKGMSEKGRKERKMVEFRGEMEWVV